MINSIFSSHLRDTLLDNCLHSVFGDLSPAILSSLKSKIDMHHLSSGSVLFYEGDVADGMYFVLNGRLRVTILEDGKEKTILQLIKEDSVGEMALITGEPRAATITAMRDTVLASLKKEDFEIIVKETPEIVQAIASKIIRRLTTEQKTKNKAKFPGIITIVADLSLNKSNAIIKDIENYLQPKLKLLVLKSDTLKLIQDAYATSLNESIDANIFFQYWFEEKEYLYDLIILVAESNNLYWQNQCISYSDTIFYFIDTSISPISKINDHNSIGPKKKGIVFIHPAEYKLPVSCASIIKNEKPDLYIHIREKNIKDYQRLARIISGNAIGLVFSGGGAKGFAHLGVYAALSESGIPIDFIGGTSIGALLGAFIAMDVPLTAIIDFVRQGALANPMGDYTVFPYLSVIKGKRLESMILNALKQIGAENIYIEDLWLNYFSISCNYTDSQAMIHTSGKLYTALRASISIPGIFPPVIDNEKLLMDGGSFNNFPTDIMHNHMGVANIIGVDIERDKLIVQNMESLPSNPILLWDQFNPFQKRKYKVPSLLNLLLNATLFYSDYRKKELEVYADLLFKPDVSKFTMLDWDAFDEIYAEGYDHAKGILSKLPPELKKMFCIDETKS